MTLLDDSGIGRTKKLFLLLLLHVFLIFEVDVQLGRLENTTEKLVAQSNVYYQEGIREVGSQEEQISLAFESYKHALKTKNQQLYQSLISDQTQAHKVNDESMLSEYQKIKDAKYEVKMTSSNSATLSINPETTYEFQLIGNQWLLSNK